MNIAALTRIDRRIDFAAPPERVSRALTDAGELGDWFQVAIEGPIVQGASPG